VGLVWVVLVWVVLNEVPEWVGLHVVSVAAVNAVVVEINSVVDPTNDRPQDNWLMAKPLVNVDD
jgi:hypothetical protein